MVVVPSALHRADDGKHFVPYGLDRFTLEELDYVEEEWIAAGAVDGHDYATTVLVRRPRDVARFSGTVLVETLHAHGITPIWMYSHAYILRSGHAWVEITSQKVALDAHVRPSDADRYGSLHIEGPDTPFDLQPSFDDPEKRGAFWDELHRRVWASSGILAQVGAALRGPDGPFDGWPLGHLLLVGHSQTGSVTTRFIDEAHESQRLADGSPVYDGFFPSGMPMHPFAACDVPIVQLLCEGDIVRPDYAFIPGMEGRIYRRDDSDEPGDRFRLYEAAGMPHMGTRYFPYNDVDLWKAQLPGVDVLPGDRMSTLPHNELFNVGLHHLVRWVADAVVPPRADRLEDGPDGFFLADEHGHSRGGIRCAQLDVPRARYHPNPVNPDGSPNHLTVGGEAPFDEAKVAALYPEPADYAERFERRLQELIDEGWLLPEDADEMRRDAS